MAEVSFKVNDTGVSGFMDKLKQQSTQMTSEFIANAQKQTKVAKEQLHIVEDQIKALEKKAKLDSQATEIALRQVATNRTITSQARIAALDEENKRKFKGGEIDEKDYVTRKKRIQGLKDRFSEDSISSGTEEQIKLLKEQTKSALLVAGYMKENLSTIKAQGKELSGSIEKGAENTTSAVEETGDIQQQLSRQLAAELHQDSEKKREAGKKKKEEDERGFSKGMLEVANGVLLEKVGSMISGIPETKNELDFVKPMMSAIGMGMGGMFGNLIDAANIEILGNRLGQTSFGHLGTQLGEKMGEFAGSALKRTYEERDETTTANYRLKAIAGRTIGDVEGFGADGLGGHGTIHSLDQNLVKFGLGIKEVADIQYNIATRSGYSRGIGTAGDIAGMEKGWGVREETSYSLLELLRSNREKDRNVGNIVGGVLQTGQGTIFKDGDRAFLNEFLVRNYTQLQKALLQSQSSVSSGTTMDILKRFEGLGGEFSSRDSRSTGLLSTIQNSLANPASDSMKALSFYVMRKNNPNMSLADTGIEIQKGMGSPMYLQSMMKYLTSQGGDESYQTYNVAAAFGLQNNLAAAKKLLRGYKSGAFKGGFSTKDLTGSGEFSMGAAQGLGEEQTSVYTRSTVEIQEAFLHSAMEGISTIKTKMVDLFGNMMDELGHYITEEVKHNMSGSGGKHQPPHSNNHTHVNTHGKPRVTGGGGSW